MTTTERKSFIKENWKGASLAMLTILIAAIMVSFSENAIVTNISFFALLTIGVSALVMRIVKARRKAKLDLGIEWIPGPIKMGRSR
jgi:hypothetical protein